jgi:hypothetical protein
MGGTVFRASILLGVAYHLEDDDKNEDEQVSSSPGRLRRGLVVSDCAG